jgi:hypothetical protein
LLGLGRARKRSRIGEWSFRVTLGASLIAGSLWVAGCGGGSSSGGSGGNNTPATTTFTLTITSSATGAQSQTAQVTVNLQS